MKIFKFSIILTITSILLAQSIIPVFAQNLGGQRLINDVNRMQNQASHAAQTQKNQLQNIIKRADDLIANRLTSLNTLSTRLQNDSRLSASEKSSLSSDIQTDINGLTTLKAKIDADTDVTMARSDIKQIITNYYVYVMFEPKIRLLIVFNNLQTVTANLQALLPQIQNLINTFRSQGKDVSQLQSLLNDVSSQLQIINTTIANDMTTIQNVSISTQNPSSVFSQVHQDIAQIVRSGFTKIRSDFSQMRPLFHQLIFTHSSITITPTQTTSPTNTSSSSPTP